MHLSTLKLWNFRKYGVGVDDAPGLEVYFHEGVNVLIGENDSGKTAIVDAIRYVLRTKSGETIYMDEKDFHMVGSVRSKSLRIECWFEGISDVEAAPFLEWIGLKSDGEGAHYTLRITLTATILEDGRIYPVVKAGMGNEGTPMDGQARDLLRVVYLKPLRDALQDMTHGYKSRIAQILQAHSVFGGSNRDADGKHKLEALYNQLKKEIDEYFDQNKAEDGKVITKNINDILVKNFLMAGEKRKASLSLTGSELIDILRQLDLVLESNKSGLGSLNLLCVAAELLLFLEEKRGLKLTLIEELEAHLHPQYQLRMLDYIRSQEDFGQFILTTHSITLAANIPLENLIVLKEDKVFPMGENYTECEADDYKFLHRFLDATKANLFFARGVIMVEGDAENLLMPSIARVLGRPLHEHGVSVVNVGSTAYKRYAKIFQRKDGQKMGIPVAVVTDLDVRSIEYYKDADEERKKKMLHVTGDVKTVLAEKCPSVDFAKLPEYVRNKAEFNEFLTIHKKDGARVVKKQERIDANQYFEDNRSEITTEVINHLRQKKAETLSSIYPEGDIKLFAAKNWTLEYEIAKSSLYKELDIAVRMAKGEQSGNTVTFEAAKKETEEVYKDGTNDAVAYQIFKPINDGVVSKAIVAQYLAEILEDKPAEYKSTLESDENLAYLVEAIKHVTPERV